MDRVSKFLSKLSAKELTLVETVIKQLFSDDTESLNLKKLKGYEDIYRVRIKDIRIIFRKLNTDIKVLEISRRSEKTYRKF